MSKDKSNKSGFKMGDLVDFDAIAKRLNLNTGSEEKKEEVNGTDNERKNI